MEAEALEVLRLIIRQTERGENLDADLLERAKAILERYDRAADWLADVRFGSFADIQHCVALFRFTPKSGHLNTYC